MSQPPKPQPDNPRATELPADREKQAKPERTTSDDRLAPDVTTHPSIKNN